MKMSCNGCRVLRKGCSDSCTIRPCLEWIKSPESQANATVFLAKFYGRAGLVNLINNGPDHLRSAIFRSLLYEACGRIVNPIYGSVGLLWSGSWHLCQAAVEAVLSGTPVAQIPSETAAAAPVPPLKGYFDIRHVPGKDQHDAPAAPTGGASAVSAELHKASRTARTRFKRPGSGGYAAKLNQVANEMEELWRASESSENEFSAETAEASHVSQAERPGMQQAAEESDVTLDLTLGFKPSLPAAVRPEPEQGMRLWSGLGVGLQLQERS